MRLAMTKWASPLQPGSASAAFFPTYATSGVGLPYRSGSTSALTAGQLFAADSPIPSLAPIRDALPRAERPAPEFKGLRNELNSVVWRE